MSEEGFEDWFFSACLVDYAKLSRAMDPLVNLLARSDRVRLVGPNTDLTFSIKGIPAIACDGHLNIPDGEIFTAPVRESVNGVIRFDCPTMYRGTTHNDVRLVFRDGKIVREFETTEGLSEEGVVSCALG
jgi:aminopeptidase